MDYKEKYEQALERARQFSEKPYLEDSAGIVEYIFPELKESEDEKVEKAIFGMVYDSDDELWSSYGVSKSDVLAWLEKQGEQLPAEWSEEDELYIRELESLVKQVWAIAEHENNKDTIHKMSDLSFFLKTLKPQLKQDEQKPVADTKVIIPKFRVGDIVKSKSQPMLSPRKIISIGKDCYWCEDRGCIGFAWEDEWELVEQKTTDKVEPKFKVGDVIRLKGSAAEYTIKRVTDTTYYTDGWSCSIERCEEDYELVEQKSVWSEEDEMRFNNIFTLLEELPLSQNWFKSLKDRVLPQPKQEWSEEDVAMLDSAIAFVEHSAFTTIVKGKNNVIAWLKSIRDKAQPQPQPRQELSEGDKRIIDNLISQLGNLYARKLIKEETKDKYVNWLKSLRPQSQWKPSDMELEVLRLAAEKDGTCLMGLYEQLKKLREE